VQTFIRVESPERRTLQRTNQSILGMELLIAESERLIRDSLRVLRDASREHWTRDARDEDSHPPGRSGGAEE